MKGFRLKDKIGRGWWEYRRNNGISLTGIEPAWRDKESTREQLTKVLPPQEPQDGVFVWREWSKVGRRIDMIDTDRRR